VCPLSQFASSETYRGVLVSPLTSSALSLLVNSSKTVAPLATSKYTCLHRAAQP
jgi:hypothetical protein